MISFRSIYRSALALGLACAVPTVAHAAVLYDEISVQDALGHVFASVTATPEELADPDAIIYLDGVAVDQTQYTNYSIVVDDSGNPLELFGIAQGGTDAYDLTFALSGIAQSYILQNTVTATGAPIDMTLYLDPALQALGDTASLVVSGTNSAVPEPLTWTMMVVGFAALGCGMRRTTQAWASLTYS